MSGTFPPLKSGRMAYYGTELGNTNPTAVIAFVPGNEKRWKSAQSLFDATLEFVDCNPYDKATIEKFVATQKGAGDSTWQLAVEDPPGTVTTYNNLVFVDDSLRYTNSREDRFTFSAHIRQVAANASSPTIPSLPATVYFPQLTNGVITQYPLTTEREYETARNIMPTGAQWASSFRGGGVTGFPTGPLHRWQLQYPSLLDVDRDALIAFHNQMGGPLRTFTFLSPVGNLVPSSDDFSAASWTRTSVTVGSATTDPFGGSLATSLTASSGDSYLTAPVLPAGLANGIIVTGSVWAQSASASSLQLSIRTASTELASKIWNLPAGGWVRLAVPATITGSDPILFRIGGASTFSSAVKLFGAKVAPLPGPGGYVSSPTSYGLHSYCRFANDRLSYRKVGPNQSSMSIEIEEFWP